VKKVFVLAFCAAASVSAAAFAKEKAAAVLDPAADLKWSDVPDRPGAKLAAVQGDPNKGAARFFIKLPAGFSVGIHHHTADHEGTVLSGTMVFNVDGKDVSLPAGSYFSFVGKKQHTTRCAEGADCLIFVDTHSKWDVVEDAPKK